jgi:prophage regulatory protein
MANAFENSSSALAIEITSSSPPETKAAGRRLHKRRLSNLQQLSTLSNGDRVLTMRSVVAITSSSRTSIDRWRRAGDFPRPLQLSPHRIGFLESEVRTWIASRKPA